MGHTVPVVVVGWKVWEPIPPAPVPPPGILFLDLEQGGLFRIEGIGTPLQLEHFGTWAGGTSGIEDECGEAITG